MLQKIASLTLLNKEAIYSIHKSAVIFKHVFGAI